MSLKTAKSVLMDVLAALSRDDSHVTTLDTWLEVAENLRQVTQYCEAKARALEGGKR